MLTDLSSDSTYQCLPRRFKSVRCGLLTLESDGSGFHLVVDLLRAAEGGLHVVADILRSHDFFEFRLMNQAGGLLPCAAENQSSIAGVQLAGDFLNCE